MKILHVLNHSVPHTDGYCIRSENIVRFQRSMGLEPIVVTSPRQEPIPTEEVETIQGIRYFRTLPKGVRTPLLREIQSVRQMTRRIEEIVRLEQPQIIHAHSPCTWGLAALKAARRCKLPFVYEIRGIWEDGAVDQGRLKHTSFQYLIRRSLETYVARRANTVVTISAGLEQEFRGRGAKNLFVVPNGVDLTTFNGAAGGDRNQNGKAISIGYIGSLYPWEGVEVLVHAASIIIESEPTVQVRIVGGGETSETVKGLIERKSLNETVKMVGKVPHSQIVALYDEIDILVYPRISTRNTELVTPLKPLEAMAQRKPIVVSNVGGLLELVGAGTASVFEAGNPVDLARKCLELVRDADRRCVMGTLAHSHVHQFRDWAAIIKIYQAVYNAAIASMAA